MPCRAIKSLKVNLPETPTKLKPKINIAPRPLASTVDANKTKIL